jgi:hypothetical protein
MRFPILAHPSDLPSHGPSLIYIGYTDLPRLPRTTPISQCGPIPTHRLSLARSPTWSQRSFASDTVAAAGAGGDSSSEAGTAHSGLCRMFAGGRVRRPADGSPLNSAGVGPMRGVSSMSTLLRSEDTTHAHSPLRAQSTPGQARPDQTRPPAHAAATTEAATECGRPASGHTLKVFSFLQPETWQSLGPSQVNRMHTM